MMKIPKNWLTHQILATLQALRKGLVRSVSLQNTTMNSSMILDTSHEYPKAGETIIPWFKCKLGLKYDENTQKLADAPNFGYTASPHLGSVWVSKPSKHYYSFKHDLIYTTQYSTGRENGF